MAINIDKGKCTGVGKCVEICPVSALKVVNGKVEVSDECIECGACVSECPTEALSMP
jgi:ferredoxin